MTTAFPKATIVGYPRIGRRRELKKAVEAYWAGRTSAAELETTAAELRAASYARLSELGGVFARLVAGLVVEVAEHIPVSELDDVKVELDARKTTGGHALEGAVAAEGLGR